MAKFFVMTNGQEFGPFTGSELKQLVIDKTLLPHSYVRQEEGSWVVARTVKGLVFEAEPLPVEPPPAKPPEIKTKTCPFCAEQVALAAIRCKHCGADISNEHLKSVVEASNKRILPAFILLIFFGPLALHCWYAGQENQGVVYWIFLVCGFIGYGTDLTGDLGFLKLLVVCWAGVAVFLLADFFRLVSGTYPDRQGRKITQWT